MASSRATVGADLFDQNLQYVSSLSNQLVPSEYFTDGLAEFCEHAAYHCDVHNISMPIILLNVVATSTGKSGVWRSNVERFPLNLYSLIVGNSSFGKSKLLRLITHGLQVISDTFVDRFKSTNGHNENCPVYNDATCAGIIASVNGCTRVLISEEADVLLPSVGAVLPSPYVNKDVPTVKSEARSELMKMFDGDSHVRKLKGSVSKMDRFKHSFIGASSGGIVITALQRKSNGSQVDGFFERLMIWCLRPVPLIFVPESEKKKPELDKYPTFEEFCVILGLFENFELFYDNDGDKMMVDFGNRYTQIAYKENDRYLMAKMGKMVQLTHRLVGFIQVLEWSWNIAAEYLRIKNHFTGTISEDFISDVRRIYHEIHEPSDTDEHMFVATISVVEKAINISEALLEQYKLLMRLPDEVVSRSPRSSSNSKKNTKKRAVCERKLEKSKSKYIEHIHSILTYPSVIFTPKTLYDGVSVCKHYSANVHDVLEELVKIGLLVSFADGVISPTKKADVFVKWLPKPNNEIECQRFERMLATFNDNRITPDMVISSTITVSLLPHKASPRPFILDYLKSDRYAQLNLDLGAGVSEPEQGPIHVNAIDDDSNNSIVSLAGLVNPNELPSTGYFCELEEDLFSSMCPQKDIDVNGLGPEGEQNVIATNVARNTIIPPKQNINVAGDENGITENPQQCEKTREKSRSGQRKKNCAKRKIHARIDDSSDADDFIQVNVRRRSSHISKNS